MSTCWCCWNISFSITFFYKCLFCRCPNIHACIPPIINTLCFILHHIYRTHIFCPSRMPFSIFHFPNVLLMFVFMCLAKESTDFPSKYFLLLCSVNYISFFFSFWFWVGQAKKFYSTLYGKQIAVKKYVFDNQANFHCLQTKIHLSTSRSRTYIFSCHWAVFLNVKYIILACISNWKIM